jgi:hypothetical protein
MVVTGGKINTCPRGKGAIGTPELSFCLCKVQACGLGSPILVLPQRAAINPVAFHELPKAIARGLSEDSIDRRYRVMNHCVPAAPHQSCSDHSGNAQRSIRFLLSPDGHFVRPLSEEYLLSIKPGGLGKSTDDRIDNVLAAVFGRLI